MVCEQFYLESAACLWEAYLENDRYNEQKDVLDDWRRFLDVWGTPHTRAGLCDPVIIQHLEDGFDLAQQGGFDAPYDWEFVPWFFDRCLIPDEPSGEIRLHKDWQKLCKENVPNEDSGYWGPKSDLIHDKGKQ